MKIPVRLTANHGRWEAREHFLRILTRHWILDEVHSGKFFYNRKLTLFCLCILFPLGGCDHTAAKNRQAVLESEAALSNSFNTGDPATIERLLTDDFVGVDIDGSHYDKGRLKQFTAHFAQSGGKYSTTDITLRLYGDVAVTQGYDHTTRADGSPGPGTAWTDTWIRRGNAWKLVAAEDEPMQR